jgi:hypothetical protein
MMSRKCGLCLRSTVWPHFFASSDGYRGRGSGRSCGGPAAWPAACTSCGWPSTRSSYHPSQLRLTFEPRESCFQRPYPRRGRWSTIRIRPKATRPGGRSLLEPSYYGRCTCDMRTLVVAVLIAASASCTSESVAPSVPPARHVPTASEKAPCSVTLLGWKPSCRRPGRTRRPGIRQRRTLGGPVAEGGHPRDRGQHEPAR